MGFRDKDRVVKPDAAPEPADGPGPYIAPPVDRGTAQPRRQAARPQKKHGPPLKLVEWHQPFLDNVERYGTWHNAAKRCGISYRTVQRYRETHPEYDRRCIEARERFADSLEEEFTDLGR